MPSLPASPYSVYEYTAPFAPARMSGVALDMTKSTSTVLLAEIQKLRDALGRMDSTVTSLQARLATIEGRLSEADEQRASSQVRQPRTRVH